MNFDVIISSLQFLKPKGLMFPSVGDLHVAPFTDEALYMEQFQKANFWYQQSFHGKIEIMRYIILI